MMHLPAETSPGALNEPRQLLHARLVLPPALAWNGARYCGSRLQRIDASAALRGEGVQQVFVKKHLVAVLASTDEAARTARRAIRASWSAVSTDRALPRVQHRRHLLQRGISADGAPGDASSTSAEYYWQPSESTSGASTVAALAVPTASGFRVDLPFGNARAIAQELASLLDVSLDRIEVRTLRAAQTGQEVADAGNAAGIAALLCKECKAALSLIIDAGAEVTRSTLIQMTATAAPDRLGHYGVNFDQPVPAPPLAWLLTERRYDIVDAGKTPASALVPPYAWGGVEISSTGASEDIAPLAATFAQESFFDELAEQAGHDPVEYRLAHLGDPQGAQLIRSVAHAASWQQKNTGQARSGPVMRGRGFAYAATIDHEPAQPARSWSAWVADVEYDQASGELSVTRVIAGHDAQNGATEDQARPALVSSPAGLLNDQARLAMSQLIVPGNGFDAWAGGNPLVPAEMSVAHSMSAIDVVSSLPSAQLKDVQLKAGAAFTLPAAAAVANAIYDATGVRLRSAPFSGEQIKLALSADEKPGGWRRFKNYGWLGGAVAALGTTLTLAMPWRPAIAPVAPPDPNLYSTATIERGRLVALAGDCIVCHTAPNGGTPNAGGHPLQTPFGTLYSTNITPDQATGIGNWSYAAFERAMREGVHRDGRNLYPAFPYTAFAKMSDGDMQSLYAYLMVQTPVKSSIPESDLRFPFNMRPLLAGWNVLFHKPDAFRPDPDRSTLWNRGAYLVEGAGHCAACHSPRNFLGAEKKGLYHLAGGVVDGWEAPALTATSKAPNPWTEQELFTYLRTGFSARHGVAAGPMAPVVAELAQLPTEDVRAMAHYLASLNETPAPAPAPAPVIAPVALTAVPGSAQMLSLANGKRLFQGACAVCHQEGTGPTLFGVRPSLKVNTSVHSDNPDNLIHVILQGIREPANPDLGYMPGFADSFSDAQMADLLTYLRTTFAPDKPAWDQLESRVAKSRRQDGH